MDGNEGRTEEPRIPRPPTREEQDAVSEAQGMITDEWAPAAREGERAEPAPEVPAKP